MLTYDKIAISGQERGGITALARQAWISARLVRPCRGIVTVCFSQKHPRSGHTTTKPTYHRPMAAIYHRCAA